MAHSYLGVKSTAAWNYAASPVWGGPDPTLLVELGGKVSILGTEAK